MRKRYVPTCKHDENCSDEEIAAIGEEIEDVNNDPNIKVYDNPSTQELHRINLDSEKYTGEWYHSAVTLPIREYLEDEKANDLVYLTEYDKLVDNTPNNGVYVSFSFSVNVLD